MRNRMRAALLALVPALALALAPSTLLAEVSVKMAGDVRIYGQFLTNQNFTGWNATGTRTEDAFQIWQRFRLRTDFVANETLKFRLGIRVNDANWGGPDYRVDNANIDIQVYQAYLQFKFPGTDVQVTAGLQPVSLPHTAIFYDSPVLSSKHESNSSAALIVQVPVIENAFSAILGFDRLVDSNQRYDPTTTQVSDEIDAYFAAFPVTLDGVSLTPWSMAAVVGDAAGPTSGIRNNMVSGGWFLTPGGFTENQSLYWWAGGALEVDALDPVKFYADVIYGQGAMSGAERTRRRGWFIDAAVEYTGLDLLTPQLGFWWSTGEDDSLSNGSERMPGVNKNFGMGGSFLFSCDQPFSKNAIDADPVGAFGLAASLNDISFMEKLKHRLTFTAMSGASSARGLRQAVLASGGNGQYVTMGKNLAEGEWLMGANFDSTYNIYDNLGLHLETGWANFSGYKASTWNYFRNFTGNAQDAWKALVGLTYTF
jgi:hypothetical protein